MTGTRPGRDQDFLAPEAAPEGAVPGLVGAIWADSGRTLGGLPDVPVGECAPEVSSGFCSGGL